MTARVGPRRAKSEGRTGFGHLQGNKRGPRKRVAEHVGSRQMRKTYCESGGRWFESTQLYHRHSDFPRIISPMQQRLALTAPAQEIAGFAMAFDLGDVPANSFPAPDLAGVLGRHAAAHVVTAVPLEPTARIIGVNPSLPAPDRQWLTGIDLEKVQRAVASRF